VPTKSDNSRISVSDRAMLQPWFLPRHVSVAIRRLLPDESTRKMRHFFDDYGCLRCDRKDIPYGSNGMCYKCFDMVRRKLKWSMKRHFKATADAKNTPSPRDFLSKAELAQKLLSGMSERGPILRQTPSNRILSKLNPAREMSGASRPKT
jgi:hypothetical protein